MEQTIGDDSVQSTTLSGDNDFIDDGDGQETIRVGGMLGAMRRGEEVRFTVTRKQGEGSRRHSVPDHRIHSTRPREGR